MTWGLVRRYALVTLWCGYAGVAIAWDFWPHWLTMALLGAVLLALWTAIITRDLERRRR